jgi:hypothetical protein
LNGKGSAIILESVDYFLDLAFKRFEFVLGEFDPVETVELGQLCN